MMATKVQGDVRYQQFFEQGSSPCIVPHGLVQRLRANLYPRKKRMYFGGAPSLE